MSTESTLVIVHVFPGLLGLYGDRGNAAVLAYRAGARGLAAQVLGIEAGTPIPASGDIYVLGGGEDQAQGTAAELMRADGGLIAAIDRGAVVFAVCAGLQILGNEFNAAGTVVPGLGVLDIGRGRPASTRAVGELLSEPVDLALPVLTGFENHQGRTILGPQMRSLGRVMHGVGNGDHEGEPGVASSEGVVHGHVIGTYMHGPALARNPALADLLIGWATGIALDPWVDPVAELLREERFAAVAAAAAASSGVLAGVRERLRSGFRRR